MRASAGQGRDLRQTQRAFLCSGVARAGQYPRKAQGFQKFLHQQKGHGEQGEKCEIELELMGKYLIAADSGCIICGFGFNVSFANIYLKASSADK